MFTNKAIKIIDHDRYFNDQTGGAIDYSIYRGPLNQSGSGVFTSLIKRYGYPIAKFLAKQAFIGGKETIQDILTGTKPSVAAKQNLRKRAAASMKNLGEKIYKSPSDQTEQSALGLRKKPKIIKRRKKSKKRLSNKQTVKSKRRTNKKTVNRKRKRVTIKRNKLRDIFE